MNLIKVLNLTLLACILFLSASLRAELECTAETPQNCLDGVGPAVTNPDKIRNTSAQISQQLRKSDKEDNSVVYADTSTQTGLPAGDIFSSIGVWSNYVFTDFEADIPINSLVQPTASYEADNHNLMVGFDKIIAEKWIVGLAAGIENTEILTEYNGGVSDADGYTIAPYMAYFINDIFSVDAAGGYSYLDYDTTRIDNISGDSILGDFNSDRLFFFC